MTRKKRKRSRLSEQSSTLSPSVIVDGSAGSAASNLPTDVQQPLGPTALSLKSLFAESNRGLLLDLFVFVINLFLMQSLTGVYVDVFQQASADDSLATLTIGLSCLGMWLLPATGAILKRWHFHQRLKAEGKTVAPGEERFVGCLFNPIFYFCLNLVLTSAVLATLGDLIFGKNLHKNGALFVTFTVAGLVFTVVQTFIIYRYFSPPKKPPKSDFLKTPQSEIAGDVCFFLNMILFQVAWNLLTFAPFDRVKGIGDFIFRLFFLSFIALLIYFPPRMFYLAEDIKRPRTWLTMLLANSPVIYRILVGTGPTWN
jgi:hypothetical protein